MAGLNWSMKIEDGDGDGDGDVTVTVTVAVMQSVLIS